MDGPSCCPFKDIICKVSKFNVDVASAASQEAALFRDIRIPHDTFYRHGSRQALLSSRTQKALRRLPYLPWSAVERTPFETHFELAWGSLGDME